MRSVEKIRSLFAKSNVTVSSKIDDRIINDALTAFAKPEKTQSVSPESNIWRIIMKSPITKLTAAAVIIIAVVFSISLLDKAATPAYALEQTIEANHTIKTIHLRMFKDGRSIENNEFSDYWIKYNDAGILSNLRCNEHDKNGVVRFTIWNEGIKKTWIPEKNVVFLNRLNNTDKAWEDFAKEFEPKFRLQWIYDQGQGEEKEAPEIEIDEPAEDSNSIYVKATHSVHKLRAELVVDRKTKLIKKLSLYHLREQEYELDTRIEFLAYNQPIDPSMFELRGIPDNAKVYDQVNRLVGLEKGDLTNEEIAAKVVREALEATIAKDYDEVRRLMEGDPGDTIEEFIEKEFEARLVRIVSIGRPEEHEKIERLLYFVPCEIEVENEERGRWIVNIIATSKAIEYQDDRWIMHTDLQVSGPYIPSTGDHGDSDTPDRRKVIMLSEQPPGPITFPKIDRKPKLLHSGSGEMKSLPKYDPDSPSPFRVDLRCRDLSKLDLSNSIDDLKYAVFDDYTVWPKSVQMPEEFDPKKMMELGKNPGLGVRTLHESGITGKGVGVAIIDQPLLTDHQEYADRLRLYEENNVTDEDRASPHGPAVASIAVGKTVGLAPDADLYYIATWNWDISRDDDPPRNFLFKAQSIRRLLEINRQLPADRKIRVISMSIGWVPSDDGYDEIMAACEEAEAAGVFVISCDSENLHGFKFYGLGRHPLDNPDVFESYEPCLWWAKDFYNRARWRDSDRLLVPMDSRTMACARGSDKYVFFRVGGGSWTPPYMAGVYALAAQVEPDITPERFWDLAIKTGRTIELEHKGERLSFGPIIDPIALIESIRKN